MANLRAQKAFAPALMRVDGNAAFIVDKIVYGASPGQGTPTTADTADFRLPGGSRVAQLEFFLDDLDTGAAALFSVGYRAVDPLSTLAASTTYFAAAGQTLAQTGGRLECAFKPIKFEEDVFIQIVWGGTSAGVAGNPEIHMIAGISQEGIR